MIRQGVLLHTPMGMFTVDDAEADMCAALLEAGDEDAFADYMMSLVRERNRVAVRVWRVLLRLEER